jgi:hypothetical protein
MHRAGLLAVQIAFTVLVIARQRRWRRWSERVLCFRSRRSRGTSSHHGLRDRGRERIGRRPHPLTVAQPGVRIRASLSRHVANKPDLQLNASLVATHFERVLRALLELSLPTVRTRCAFKSGVVGNICHHSTLRGPSWPHQSPCWAAAADGVRQKMSLASLDRPECSESTWRGTV